MRKHLLLTAAATMAMSLMGTLSSMAQGYQTTIPFVETFDDETHYTLGGDLPDGWLGCSGNEDEKGFVKTQHYDNGLKAYSGDNRRILFRLLGSVNRSRRRYHMCGQLQAKQG